MSFQDDLLSTHNEKRKKHGAPPLKWSDALERKATKWAQHLAKIDSLKHEQNVEEGENIAMAGGEIFYQTIGFPVLFPQLASSLLSKFILNGYCLVCI